MTEEDCKNVTVTRTEMKIDRTCTTKVRNKDIPENIKDTDNDPNHRLTKPVTQPRLTYLSASVNLLMRRGVSSVTKLWSTQLTRRSATRISSMSVKSISRCP